MNTERATRMLSVCFFWALFLLSQSVRAEAARVLFVTHEQTPFSARIRAEIESMDFQVVLADTLTAADGARASAAANVIESPPSRRVELWLRRDDTGQLALDRVLEAEQVEEYGGSAIDATSAVRVSEQLRAFFQPLRERAAVIESMPPRPPPPPLAARVTPQQVAPAPAAALPPTDDGRIFQELAAAVPLQPGSLGLDLLLRARYRFGKTYGLGVKVVLPMVPSTVSSGSNSADVSSSLFGVEVSAVLVTTRLATLGAHAGLSLLMLNASGNAQPPYTNGEDRKFSAFPSFGSQLGFRVAQQLRLCLGAELGMSVPELEVAFAGQPVTSWARPLALFSAGVAAAWGNP